MHFPSAYVKRGRRIEWSMLRVAEQSNISELADMLTLAFDSDPVLRWVMRNDDKRSEALRRLLTYILRESIPYSEVMTTEELDACAVWVPPGIWSKPPGLLESIRMLPETLRWTGWSRFKKYMDLDVAEFAKPSEPYFYLVILGVHPDRWGLGLASALLCHTLSRLDVIGMPAYLENSNLANQSLYQHCGFKVLDEITQSGGPSEWCMWREPTKLNHCACT